MGSSIKRWVPLVGSAVLVAVVTLRLLGQTELAGVVESLAGVLGLTQQSPVSGTEVTAALAAAVGIALKLIAEFKRAKGGVQ
jgi:hypothetical protein